MRSALIRPRKLSKADKVVARSWSAPAKASRKAWSRERIAAVLVICWLRSSINFLKTCAPARKRESICATGVFAIRVPDNEICNALQQRQERDEREEEPAPETAKLKPQG